MSLLTLGLLLAGSPNQAGAQVHGFININFDDLGTNVVAIRDQYAALGMHFAAPVGGADLAMAGPPQINGAFVPSTGDFCGSMTGGNYILIKFDRPVQSFSADLLIASATNEPVMQLWGWNAAGLTTVGPFTYYPRGARVWTNLSLTASAGEQVRGIGLYAFNSGLPVSREPGYFVDTIQVLYGPPDNVVLTVQTNGNGAVTRNPDSEIFTEGDTVRLTATPADGSVFIGWSGDISSGANPLDLAMTSNLTVTANFRIPTVSISVTGQGTVSKSPDLANYRVGDSVALTANPARWFRFTGWGDGLTDNPRTITVGSINSYSATFAPTVPLETVMFGVVSRTGPIGMPSIFVNNQFEVTGSALMVGPATVAIGTTFPGGLIFYTLDGTAPDFAGQLYSGPFVLERPATIRAIAFDANFQPSVECDPVTVRVEPTFPVSARAFGGGTVTVSPHSAAYRSNTVVTLNAVPLIGWTFLEWLGDAAGNSNQTSLTVADQGLCAQALFGTTLDVHTFGSGTVRLDPTGPLYPYGTVVKLTAVPSPDNYFGTWGNPFASVTNPLILTITNATPSISCAFGSLSVGQAALAVSINGLGRVTVTPPGNRFSLNQLVTLRALPDLDQVFLGWTGDLSETSTNVTITLTQSKTITANFTKRPMFVLDPCLTGLRSEGLRLTSMGQVGVSYRVDASTNLATWIPLSTFTNQHGLWQMSDPASTNFTQRFYRCVEQD